jgi:hypothetical protein
MVDLEQVRVDLDKVRVDMDDPSFITSETRVYDTLRALIGEIESLRTEQQGWQDLFVHNSKRMLDDNDNLRKVNKMLAEQLKQLT